MICLGVPNVKRNTERGLRSAVPVSYTHLPSIGVTVTLLAWMRAAASAGQASSAIA